MTLEEYRIQREALYQRLIQTERERYKSFHGLENEEERRDLVLEGPLELFFTRVRILMQRVEL